MGAIAVPPARRRGPSPRRRSRSSRPSPTKPSSRSRTCGCSRSCRRATASDRGAGTADGDERDPAASSVSSPTDVQPVLDAIVEKRCTPVGAPVRRPLRCVDDGNHRLAGRTYRRSSPDLIDFPARSRLSRDGRTATRDGLLLDATRRHPYRLTCRLSIPSSFARARTGARAVPERPLRYPCFETATPIGSIMRLRRSRCGRSRGEQIELLADLRRPGGHRYRERAAVQRARPQQGAERVAGTADGDRRRSCG